MNPFLREHAKTLLGSALLHVAIFALIVGVAWFSVAPKRVLPATIESYVMHAPAARAAPAAPATPAVTPPAPAVTPAEVKPPPADPAPQLLAREQAARAEREAADHAHVEAEAHKRAAAQAEQQRLEAEARAEQHRRDVAAIAEKHRLEAENKRKAAETAQRGLRETDLAHQLDAEEHRLGAENAGLLARYVAELQARIERAWNRPPTAKPGLSCVVNVTQVPGGVVTSVHLGDCNGDAAVQQSIVLAVYRASPLPAPPDPSLFDRNLRLVFEPQ